MVGALVSSENLIRSIPTESNMFGKYTILIIRKEDAILVLTTTLMTHMNVHISLFDCICVIAQVMHTRYLLKVYVHILLQRMVDHFKK